MEKTADEVQRLADRYGIHNAAMSEILEDLKCQQCAALKEELERVSKEREIMRRTLITVRPYINDSTLTFSVDAIIDEALNPKTS